jgi:hypothetical protein
VAYNPCGVLNTSQMLAKEVLKHLFWNGERVLGRAVFAAKCSLITWYPTNDNYYGPAVLWTLFGDPALRVRHRILTGVEESRNEERGVRNEGPTVVRGVLNLQPAICNQMSEIVLLDVAGRKLASLRPGANDVSHLAPGIYFLRLSAGDCTRQGTVPVAVSRKLVIQ